MSDASEEATVAVDAPAADVVDAKGIDAPRPEPDAVGTVDAPRADVGSSVDAPRPEPEAGNIVDAAIVDAADAYACDLSPCMCGGVHVALCCNGPCPTGFEGLTCYCGDCRFPSHYVPDGGRCEL